MCRSVTVSRVVLYRCVPLRSIFVLCRSVSCRSVSLSLYDLAERVERVQCTCIWRENEMPYSDYLKHRALFFHAKGLSPPAIADTLTEEGLVTTRQGLAKFIRRFKETGSMKRCPGSGRPSKVTPEVKAMVEAQMREDDQTTVQLCALLRSKGCNISQSTILRSRSSLGWTFRGSAYCQMIRQVNKAKRLEWAQQNAHEAATGFLDVVYTDGTSIQLEAHRWFCCRKRGEPPRHKPR